ncbi:Receptor-type tyrosine-protein phosphatase alpha-like [Oopsacas minuta]|uniref:protein-tyrosine-phosphatase n=1 Tax=Oopsacas minuta TaxID=111878 RepID=A0AAV7K718_9METZ|nr:Receptor-type tyrosine-protein phosphatase alpha-like [Oopsacas minuta]
MEFHHSRSSLSFILLLFLSIHQFSYSTLQFTFISETATKNATYQYNSTNKNANQLYISNETSFLQIECMGDANTTSLYCQNNTCPTTVINMSTNLRILQLNSSHQYQSNYTCRSGVNNITVEVLIGRIPVISIANQSTIFVPKNGSFVLQTKVNSLPEAAIQWYLNSQKNFTTTNTTFPLLQIDSFNSDLVGNYTLVASNKLGSSSITFVVNLVIAPAIISHNVSRSYPIEYSNVTLLIELDNTPIPSPTVNWLFNSNQLMSSADYILSNYTEDGKQYYSLKIVSITRNLAGNYTVEVMNIFCTRSSSFVLTIGSIPVNRVLNGDLTYLINSTATLCCANTADPPVENIMWQFNNESLSDLDNGVNETLIIPRVQLSDAGQYTCTPSNVYGSITIPFNLIIHSPPVFNHTKDLTNIVINTIDELNLTCYALGIPIPQIEWSHDNEVLTDVMFTTSGATQIMSTLTVYVIENATYTCRAFSNITSSPGMTQTFSITANYTVYVILPTPTTPVIPPVSPVIPFIQDSLVFTALFCVAILFMMCLAIALAIVCLLQQRLRTMKIIELNSPQELSHNLEMTIIHPNDKFQTLVPKEYAMLDSLSESGIVIDVKVSEIAKYIENLKANDKLGFSEQYDILRQKAPEHDSTVGDLQDNISKNRYKNIYCYDHSRVKLTPLDDTHNDFIHANFVGGYNHEKEYIATQGPLENTVDDMWRMVWEYKCSSIVMLTKCMENLKRKCALYWVEEGRTVFFQIAVTHISSLHLVDYSIIKLSLQPVDYTGEKLQVSLFQFISWPDFGTPDSPAALLHFRNKVRDYHPYNSINPMVVHCSAGVGRSGTFIALDIELQKASMEDKINPFTRVLEMRDSRNYLVQTESQFIFLHDAILEGILFGYEDTTVTELPILIDNLLKIDPDVKKTGFELDFKALTSGKIDTRQFSDGNLPVNIGKNRSTHILPFNKNRVKLTMMPGVDGSDYINASIIDSYAFKHVFISTQAPMDSTICDFWRMIFERNVHTVIMLCNLIEHKTEVCAKYWPEIGDELDLDAVTITNQGEEQNDDLKILERDLKVEYKKLKSSRVIKHYNFQGWYDNRFPEDLNGLIELLDIANECNNEDKRAPILVHCSTGVGRTGVFCSLYNSIEQATFEECVNLFYVIKKLRLQRIHTIQSLQQYQFCYQALAECLRAIEEKDS